MATLFPNPVGNSTAEWYEAEPEAAEPFAEWVERIIGEATGDLDKTPVAERRRGPLSDFETSELLRLLDRANMRAVARGGPGFDVDALVRQIGDTRVAMTGDGAMLLGGAPPVVKIAAGLLGRGNTDGGNSRTG